MKENYLMAMLLAGFVCTIQAENLTGPSGYTLLNPTPDSQLREWYTDHAGASPYTIDAGHFVADVGFSYLYARVSSGPVTVTENGWAIGATRIKAGLLDNLEFSISILPYETVTVDAGGPRQTISGSGDLSTDLRWNLWGNDGGATAFAVSGGVTFPTGTGDFSDDSYSGGISAEFAAHLPYDFMLQIDSGVGFADFSTTGTASQFEASFGNSISIHHAIVKDVTGYCAFSAGVSTVADSDWAGTIRVGLDYRVKKNVELYVGDDFFVQPFEQDVFTPFAGVAVRF
jgi:Putative MetA-pathway of phenol degradation